MMVAAWMGIIFFLSHQPADTSGALSGGLLEIILIIISFFEGLLDITVDREVLHFLLRKGAHFTAYFILGVLLINALWDNHKKKPDKNFYIQAFIIAVIYAISDEYHQTFIPGRAGQIQDVLIDSAGAGTALLGRFFLVHFIHRRKDQNPRH